jgi:hypothetical protein
MAHFIVAKQSDGTPVWINVDRVRYVTSTSPASNNTRVYFDADDAIDIADEAAVVVDSSRKRREGRSTN